MSNALRSNRVATDVFIGFLQVIGLLPLVGFFTVPVVLTLTLLVEGCGAVETLKNLSRQAATGCGVIAGIATASTVLSVVSIAGLPATPALGSLSALAGLLAGVFGSLGAGRAPTAALISGVASALRSLGGVDAETMNKAEQFALAAARQIPDTELRKMATTKTVATAKKPRKLVLIKVELRRAAAKAANSVTAGVELGDTRPAVMHKLTELWIKNEPLVAAVLRRGPIPVSGQTYADAQMWFGDAVKTLAFVTALDATARVYWSYDDAKRAIDDPATAPKFDGGDRQPVDGGSGGGGGGGGGLVGLFALGALAAAFR